MNLKPQFSAEAEEGVPPAGGKDCVQEDESAGPEADAVAGARCRLFTALEMARVTTEGLERRRME